MKNKKTAKTLSKSKKNLILTLLITAFVLIGAGVVFTCIFYDTTPITFLSTISDQEKNDQKEKKHSK
ncbi:MAG: hypothetical protein FWE57_11825, partial [Chitinispirillia bacterium]|nr:hypothetical protein [Chitinispirillia bacterium]